MNFQLIEKKEELLELSQKILQEQIKEIALDFEGESNLHRYGFHLCLIQLKIKDNSYIIDVKKVKDISAFKEIFENPEIIKLMYGADFDVKLLFHTKKIAIKGMWDLQVAAKLLGLTKLSLQNGVKHFLDKEILKSKGKQQANWNLRPLKDSLLEYAAYDVEYLSELKNILLPKLKEKKLYRNFLQQSENIQNTRFKIIKAPWKNYAKIKKFSHVQIVLLKHLWKTREKLAKEKDVPVFKIITNNSLLKVVQKLDVDNPNLLFYKELNGLSQADIQLFKTAISNAELEIKKKAQ